MLKNKPIQIILIFFLLFQPVQLLSQDLEFHAKEDSLAMIGNLLWKSRQDSVKVQLADSMAGIMFRTLNMPGSYSYNFDSLKGISRLRSQNSDFRIFSWNTPFSDGTFRFDAIIQCGTGKLYPMMHKGPFPLSNQSARLTSKDWYGAVYYSLIESEIKGKNTVTLLGWNGNSSSSNIKVIDILSFDASGEPVFGDFIFKTSEGIKPRVIVEYAENANALIRYDYQKLVVKKGKRLKESPEWMIVMDHLAPMSSGMEGMRKYYVPTGDTYDAYIQREGYWVLAEDIIVANPVTPESPSGK